MVRHVIWTPYQQHARFLRSQEKYRNPDYWVIVVGTVERLRGLVVDDLYIFDPHGALASDEIAYAHAIARTVEWLYL